MKKKYERIPTRREAENNVIHSCDNCEWHFQNDKDGFVCAAYLPWNNWDKEECPEWKISFREFLNYGKKINN